ncbi:centrosome-associated protein ALMS1 isoform X3 [Myxocyprinus asiaticus]|uniref:centrosome-associated protein ALMS1 isoform X3 n=1 Tax=Myxocyprinus asiaticus TaxID=70543 RepID=UPI002222FD5F|nr:centrosome-associated protein ALMS1 isoform X3 [Myxocyprinus asiaticus]
MESEGHAADVNKTPAENPCEQQGQHMHGSEGFRQHTNPDDFSRPFSNTQDSSALINRPETLQLEFQDSQLSPALTLLPCLDKPHTLSDSTFLQHTDAEFVPLRGFPDLSVISERCARMSHVGTAGNSHLHDTIHDQATLSQHPLEVPEALSEVESSCCSLSQHRLSPDNHCKAIKDGESVSCGSENKIDRHMEGEEQSAAQWRSKGVSARSLLVFGEEDVGVAVSSSNAVSSSSKTALNQLEAISDQQNTAKTQLELSMNVQTDREQPQGGSLSSSFQKTTGSTVGADVSNITFRESRMHLHQTSQSLCDQLLCVGERGSISVPSSRPQSGNKSSNSGLYVAPASGGVMHVPGQQRVLWSSGNQTAADDSFLNSHPVSQSTPAVLLMRPPPSLTKLSLIDSQQESVATEAASSQNSHLKTGLIPSLDLNTVDQHSSPICPQTTVTVPSGPSLCSGTAHKFLHVHPVSYEQETPPVFSPHVPDAPCSDRPSLYSGTEMKDHVSRLALGRVQSLPSLNYLQKVDAWKASQNSSSSFYDGVSPKKKAQDAVSETLNSMLSRDMHQASGANASSQMTPPPLSSSHSGSVSPSRVDVVGAGVGRGQAVESSVNRSHSHSSLSSVVTSIQRDMGTHIGQVLVGQTDDVIPTTRSLGNQSSLLSGGRSGGVNSSAIHMEKSSVKLSPLISLVHFSDVSSSLNMSSTLSSSQGSYHGEQSMRASVGAASSVVSLEVDNYAPYWTSGHASPSHTRELNIEDRIPMYLLNLGIDQSPSTILNPFTRRGPIREPEFSPTDLCTIKGSIGTPTKSTQPSEVDSLQKETFSSSSQLSADSIASVTHHLSVHEQGQPASQRSERTIFSQTDTPPGLTLHPSSGLQQSDAPQHEGCLPIQLSPESMPAPPGPRVEVKEDDDSLVASGTLHEIRHLLGCAESLVSGRSSLTSSPGSHRLSESDTSLVSLGRNSRVYDDTSLSTGGKFSLLLTRSSSDSALKGSSSSSQGQQRISIQTDRTTTELAALSLSREGSLKSHDLCVTPRRAEPEGCSAADPDKAKPPTALSVMQMNVPSGAGNLPQNQEQTENAVLGSSETSLSNVSAEVGSLSDSSSESSLAARVAKLLQSESPVSMVTSRPSTADSEDSRAREWILMKVSGRRCESLELNAEDRARIEDIKRELLLDTKHTKSSSDSEGSAQSSVGVGSQPVKDFFGEHNISEQPQKAGQKPLDSSVLFHMLLQQDLEAKVHQIALREGFSPPPLTSISIATTRRTQSPQLPSHYPVKAVPTLLPYKPHGSSKLFYMQQAYPELSPDCSDTTVESSHPGSDDAVPPRFNIEILGSRELEDNIITPKHKEGIYSKRANMKRVSSNVSGSGLPESVVSVTGRYDSTALEVSDVSEKDMEFSCIDQEYEDEDKNFVPLHMEADYSTHGVHLHSSTMQEPKLPPESHHLPSQTIRKSYRVNTKGQERSPHDVSMEISSSLDQLWRRFSEKWSMEETRPSSERDTSLLDRLERLSRLIHNTTPTQKPIKQPDSRSREYERSDHQEGKTEEGEKRERMQLPVAPKQAWAEQEENQENVHRCPAERDESASVSMETSSSLSTIDTERLLRAFGPQRVTSKGLKSNDSLLKLYNTINKQKTGRRKPSSKHAAVSINMENVSTDDSTVSADSLSSSSTFSLPSQRGVSHSHTTKRSKVKLVSKGVQAGDLEIVMNGTRRHTRDVGTIFPSPGAFRSVHWPDTLSSGVHGGITIPTASTANPTQTPAALKRDTCNKGIRNHYPNGVSWFVSADELKSDGPKENQVESAPSQSQAWFEAYSRSRPWREPVREPLRERQIQVEQERPTESRTAIETDSCGKLSALVRLSLQEALELHRPEFVSRSRERMKRLGLLVEERRLQAVFDREREELFNCPRPTRPLRPAPVPRKQVVPRREMVQRSKEKYAQLPEVQKRREEERRQAEYRSYRLSAQLFNKKITNRVLGRRSPWQ